MYQDLNQLYELWISNGRNVAEVARKLKLPRTTVRDRLVKAKELFNHKKPVIAFWDIETSHTISAHYGKWGVNINDDNILHDWVIICAAWKILGEKTIHTTSLLDDMKKFKKNNFDVRNLKIDDSHVVKTIHDFLSGVDILVHHNGDKFDIKKFNARAIHHGLDPINHLQTVDTLKVARKHFSITSNKLDYLCKFFGIEGKIHNDRGLALRASLCDPDAIRDYVKYNKRDVFPSLEKLYLKMLPYMTNHPNLSLYYNSKVCVKCGSTNIKNNGLKYNRTTANQMLHCNDCGGNFVDKKAVKKTGVK